MRLPLTRSLAILALLAPAAWAEVPTVATDIPPVHSLVAQVMGDLGTPVLLMDQGADPHDYQMRPSQARALDSAGLLVWVGTEMTPWLADLVAARPEAAALALLDLPQTRLRRFATGAEAHADREGGGSHGNDGPDPHAWLDPANARVWLAAIAGALSAQDPQNAATYAANAEAAAADIDALDRDLAARLTAARATPILTEHDAYGYFADRYGLTVIGSLAAGDAATPGAARLAAIRDAVAGAAGRVCIFAEAWHETRLAEQLAEDLGLRIGTPLDPEGAALAPGRGLYAALLTAMAESIAACATQD